MSTSEDLRELSETLGYRTQIATMQRAADEIDALQAKLDRVRELCDDRVDTANDYNESVRFVAWDVLEIINDDGPSIETLARWADPVIEKGGGE